MQWAASGFLTLSRIGFMFFRSAPSIARSIRSLNHARRLCGQTSALVGGALVIAVGLSASAIAQNNDPIYDQGYNQGYNQNYTVLSGSEIAAQTQAVSAPSSPSAAIAAVAAPAAPSPAPAPFSPNLRGILDLTNGAESIQSLGQLRPRDVDALAGDDVGWLADVILPLYVSPGGDHWGWIYQGWVIPSGQTYLAIGRDASLAMIRAYENLYTFPVLEARADGWFRVQYSSNGSAWAHSSQLELGDVALTVEGWEERLRSQPSLYFLETGKAQPLRSQPEAATNMLGMVPTNSLIEPLDFQGDWMQVRVTRPASACRALTGATVTEGWMRWRGDNRESLVWYRPGDTCS